MSIFNNLSHWPGERKCGHIGVRPVIIFSLATIVTYRSVDSTHMHIFQSYFICSIPVQRLNTYIKIKGFRRWNFLQSLSVARHHETQVPQTVHFFVTRGHRRSTPITPPINLSSELPFHCLLQRRKCNKQSTIHQNPLSSASNQINK